MLAIPALASCAAVPDITFADDAGDDGGAVDSGVDAVGGGHAKVDSSDDAPADAPATCPAAPPPNATTCCGSNLPCSGDCGTTNCMRCAMQCGPTQLCCAKVNNVMCQPLATGVCH